MIIFFDTIDECKVEAEKSKENIVWIEKIENKAEFRFDEIKDLLLKSIREYGCEAELRIFFANNPNEYMIIIYNEYLRRLKIYIRQSRLMILFWNVIGIK